MPLERQKCEGCGEVHPVCPQCKSRSVSSFEDYHTDTPNQFLLYADESEQMYKHVCWECGWEERIYVFVDRIVEDGDAVE